MKTLIAIAVVAVMTASACGDSNESVTEDVSEDTGITSAMKWHPQSGNEGDVPGASGTLQASEDGVSVRIEAKELNAGHAYTAWWIIANNPQACAANPEPCTPADVLGNPETDSLVTFATGMVVEDTEAVFESELSAGEVPGNWFEGGMFSDPTGAEVHVALNDHGPALDEYLPGMVSTYRGGCTDESIPEAFPPSAFADGEAGPNACTLWQSVIFQQ